MNRNPTCRLVRKMAACTIAAGFCAVAGPDWGAFAQSKHGERGAGSFREAQDLFTDNNKIIDLQLKLDTPNRMSVGNDGQVRIDKEGGGVRLNPTTRPGELVVEPLRSAEELEGDLNTRKGGLSLRYKLPLGEKRR